MAARLTDTWNQHAFPDDAPGREEFWSLDSERRRVADRTDFDLEQSGSTNKIRRFTTDRDDAPDSRAAKEKAADDMITLLAIGSPAYMRAYNTQMTFQIDGQEIEMTQGRLHDLAKRRAEDLRRQINAAKQRGASAEETARLQDNLDAYRVIRDNADPRLGSMTPDRRQAIDDAIAGNADVQNMLRKEAMSLGASEAMQSELSDRMHQKADTIAVLDGWASGGGGTSFAATIENLPSDQAAATLADQFEQAKARTAPGIVEPDERPDPAKPSHGTGISL
jgi:hypothetical protein